MILDPIFDLFRGKAITIPPLDGVFRPNTHLDDATSVIPLPDADNLVQTQDGLVAASGNALYRIAGDTAPIPLRSFDAPISAVAVSPQGEWAVALETGVLHIGERREQVGAHVRCITALSYGPDGTLWVANGSSDHAPAQWSTDLMRKGSSGSIWTRDAKATEFQMIADGLAFPYGLLPDADGVVISESWQHRLVRIGRSGARSTILAKLPGYPARLAPAAKGGIWLCLFAPRNRLIEFVLQEQHYRFDMMREVPAAFWVAPALSSGRSFLEPLQCGGIKTMGVHKPWSPSRSYGLVVRLDEKMQPLFSLHSRANGNRHGVCSILECDGKLWVAAKGGDCVLALDIDGEGRS